MNRTNKSPTQNALTVRLNHLKPDKITTELNQTSQVK